MKNIIALLAFTLTIMSCEKIELYDENNNIKAEIVETEYFKMVEMPEYPGDVDYDSYDKLPLNPNTRKYNDAVLVFDPNGEIPDNYVKEDYYNSSILQPHVRIFVVNDDFETLDARFYIEKEEVNGKSIYLKKGYNYATYAEGGRYGGSIARGTINHPFKIVDFTHNWNTNSTTHPANKIYWKRYKYSNGTGARTFTREVNEHVVHTGYKNVSPTEPNQDFHTHYFVERGLVRGLNSRAWVARPTEEGIDIHYSRSRRYIDHGNPTKDSKMLKQPNGLFLPHVTFMHRADGQIPNQVPYHPYKDFFSNDVTDQTWEIYDGYTLKYTNEDPIVLPKHEVQEMYGYLFGKTPPIR